MGQSQLQKTSKDVSCTKINPVKFHNQGTFFRWENVEDETKTVDVANATEVKLYALKLYRSVLTYLNELRAIEVTQLGHLRCKYSVTVLLYNLISICFMYKRKAAKNVYEKTQWGLYKTIAIIITVLFIVAPVIGFMVIKTTLAGEVSISTIRQ